MDGGILEPSLYTVKAIAILDNDGNRLITKYYDDQFPSAKEQKQFEKNLFNKTHRANSEIIMFEGLTCVYKSNVDLFFYVIGSSQENELILASVLNALYDSVSQILRKNVEKRALLENLDAVFLAVDEICDGGIILDSDSSSIVQKVAVRNDDIPLGEQTVAQIIKSRLNKEQIEQDIVLAQFDCTILVLTSELDKRKLLYYLLRNFKRSKQHLSKKLEVLQSAKEQIKWSLLK